MSASKTRNNYLLRVYGITLDQYNNLLKKQNNGCAICGKPKAWGGKNLAVDHDHVTMYIRGLLCSFCNQRLIGRHRSPVLFESAAKYLSQHTEFIVPKKKKKRRKKRS